MSLHSAPYGSTDVLYSPPQRPYMRERSLTLPRRNKTKFKNRNITLVNTTSYEENKPVNSQDEKLRFSSVSSDGNNKISENTGENWNKLKALTRQVEGMRGVADHLFPSVEVIKCKEFEIDYDGSTAYEEDVHKLRQTIEEQMIRMKTHWDTQGSRRNSVSNEEDFMFEQMRFSISDLFTRLKPIVEGLVPSVEGEFIMTRARVDELKNQISNLETSVRQLAQTSKSPRQTSRQFHRASPGYEELTKSVPVYWGRRTSTLANESESRIRELEEELQQSLGREEALQFKLKELEERKDDQILKMEEQRSELEELLIRSGNRAKKSSQEAYSLKMQVTKLANEAEVREHQLGVSERKRTDLEAQLVVRRGNEMREQVGQLRASPDTHYSYKPDGIVYRGNTPATKPVEPTQQFIQARNPHRMSVSKERNTSVTSQGSCLDSPRDRKQVVFRSEVPKMGYNMQIGREYRGATPQRYLVGAS